MWESQSRGIFISEQRKVIEKHFWCIVDGASNYKEAENENNKTFVSRTFVCPSNAISNSLINANKRGLIIVVQIELRLPLDTRQMLKP